MPFGLKNTAQSFQRMMDKIFGPLPFLFVYLDDILVASRPAEEHLEHLKAVFSLLLKNGLKINAEKCTFMVHQVEFLGHQVDADGVRPLVSHVEAVESFPAPGSCKDLQKFLGLVNFYSRFIPRAALVMKPLTDALAGDQKNLGWTEECQAAFVEAKRALSAATTLVHPDAEAELSLATDASSSHVGAVLQQRTRSGWAPLAYYSKKLFSAQRNYSTFDRELLAVFMALHHFRFFLEGRMFVVFTDHKPLVSALQRITPPASARQQRQLAYVAEFEARLVHTPGAENVVADVLSRPPVSGFTCMAVDTPELVEGIDFHQMALLQSTCPDVQKLRSSSLLQISSSPVQEQVLFGDVSTGVFRPLVPRAMRRAVFDKLHVAMHPGVRASRRLVAARFLWPAMNSEVAEWARSCLTCQQSKISRHVHLQPEHIPVPARRFAHVHVNLVGPLTTSSGCSYIFTMVDRATRWVEAVPLSNITAAECAAAFCSTWVARYGVPAQITSDRGAQFSSKLWQATCQLLGIQHILSSSFHPQSNGILERCKAILERITLICAQPQENINRHYFETFL
jgi:transposase InsO family protein